MPPQAVRLENCLLIGIEYHGNLLFLHQIQQNGMQCNAYEGTSEDLRGISGGSNQCRLVDS